MLAQVMIRRGVWSFDPGFPGGAAMREIPRMEAVEARLHLAGQGMEGACDERELRGSGRW